MRLSEAIRLGAMLKPQGRGGWMDGPGSCALAAACDASGIVPVSITNYGRRGIDYEALRQRFPVLWQRVRSPTSGEQVGVELCIWCLNDCRGWTREQIADWVAGVEPDETTGAADDSQAARAVAVSIG